MKDKTPITTAHVENADRIAFLITGYIRSTLTDQEKDELDEWITSDDANVDLFARLTDPAMLDESLKTYNSFNSVKALSVIKAQLVEQIAPKHGKIKSLRWLPYTVAASLTLILTIYLITKNSTPSKDPSFKSLADVRPGTNKAALTLADGRTILLDSINEKSLQADTHGFSQNNGRLVYSPSVKEGEQGNLQYHTLSIPRGGQYQLRLPDGSVVWLNAESSIRFPSTFEKSKRQVEITGEVFMDITKKADQPFYVSFTANNNGIGQKAEIRVIGTSFNINAYKNEENSRVALLEGKIQLTSAAGYSGIINKGQSATFINQNIIVSSLQNTEEVTAWKNGWFEFKNASIESIMKQVARWYNIEVQYEGKINYHFNASIEREVPAAELLKLLEQTGRVHFELHNNKIIVKP